MAEKNNKLTPFEQEKSDTAKIILDYKLSCEANVVSILYKVPDELYNYNLTINEFHKRGIRVGLCVNPTNGIYPHEEYYKNMNRYIDEEDEIYFILRKIFRPFDVVFLRKLCKQED